MSLMPPNIELNVTELAVIRAVLPSIPRSAMLTSSMTECLMEGGSTAIWRFSRIPARLKSEMLHIRIHTLLVPEKRKGAELLCQLRHMEMIVEDWVSKYIEEVPPEIAIYYIATQPRAGQLLETFFKSLSVD